VNAHTIYSGAPVLEASVPHGKRYLAGNASSNDTFYIVHLYGTPYEMGFAYGSLFKAEIPVGLKAFVNWIGSQLEAQLPFLPPALADILAEFGYDVAMEVPALMSVGASWDACNAIRLYMISLAHFITRSGPITTLHHSHHSNTLMKCEASLMAQASRTPMCATSTSLPSSSKRSAPSSAPMAQRPLLAGSSTCAL
jgi:hypothetical protein